MECADVASVLRQKFVERCPELDLNEFRLFSDERMCKDGSTILQPFTAPPHAYLSSWPISEQLRAINSTRKDWLRYPTYKRYGNEVPLPTEAYAKIKLEIEEFHARQARIQRCREAGVEYNSDEKMLMGLRFVSATTRQ